MIADRNFKVQCCLCEEKCQENVCTPIEAQRWVESALECAKEPITVRMRLLGNREQMKI